ncbi:MAG: protein jag [Deltaproteobacteria bacterium]|nr:protein jag [Deltaproteobacteria bacterium]
MDTKTIEIEGKTIDDAIEKACQEYDLPREKLNIEIISEGSSGFLGLVGSKKACIRASIMSIDLTMESPPKERMESTFTAAQSEKADVPRTEEIKESLAAKAKEKLDGILKRMGLDFPVHVEETSETIILKIEGDGSGLLIGKGGQTLDALQYIVNKASNKNGKGRKRIILDTEDYRKRREKTLIALAEKLGEKVKKTKKPVTVNPMNAHDRRIIHLALQDDKQLTTKSRGEGAFRKIIIVPARKS